MRGLGLVVLAVLLSGCSDGDAMRIDVQAYNDSAEAVEVRFRATSHDGRVITEVTDHAPPGYSIVGHVSGSPGMYTLEAWALGEHAELHPGKLPAGSVCNIYLANPDPLHIDCS